jgi:hypothetical protein
MYSYGYKYGIKSQKPTGVTYSAEAQALFDYVGDVPEVSKTWYDRIITAYVDSGAWAETGFKLMLSMPSADFNKQIVEVKGLTSLTITKSNNTAWATPFDTGRESASSRGVNFAGSGFVDTGFNRSLLVGTNSNAVQMAIYGAVSSYDNVSAGTYSPANRGGMHIFRNTNQFWVENWSATAGTGTHKYLSATGVKGIYSFNRRATNDAEMRIAGSVVQAVTTINGSPPNLTDFVNSANNAGAPFGSWNQSPIPLYCVMESGLSQAAMDTLEAEVTTCLEGLGLQEGQNTKLIIWDGNSHPNNWWAKMVRVTELEFAYGAGNDVRTFCVSGQTTANMNTDYASQISPLVDANTIVVPFEMTNHYAVTSSAATVKAAYQTYCEAVQADGGKVVAMGMMARSVMGTPAAGALDEINEWLRDNWATFADAFVDLPSWAYVPQGATPIVTYAADMSALTANTTYYQADRIHLTESAYQELTDLVNAQITTLL